MPRRARTLGIPLLAAAILAGVAFILWPKPGAERPAEPAPVVVPPAPSPMTEKSDASAEPAEPEGTAELVTLQLDSSPSGAFVTINGEKRGTTPLALELERGTEATVRFSLQGYRAEQRHFIAAEDDSLRVRLKRKSRPKPPPIKTDF